jgi:hypothetical protein
MSVAIQENKLQAVSVYGLSCTNKAYGIQLNSTVSHSGYILAYSGIAIDTTGAFNANSANGGYLGHGCLYSGAGLTNSSAIVSGDVARSAANAIISGVTSRLMVAMDQNADTAAHMSYSSNENGIGMAANRIIGGLSIWTNYSSTDFENDQTFSNAGTDSNKFDADSDSLSFGIDKKFGNIVVGLSGATYETDITTSVNTGTYKADGETYGIYGGLDTGVLMITGGLGTGEFDFDTTRLDQGTGNTTISGKGSADVFYMHFAAQAALSRGKFTLMPRVAYRSLDLDNDAFSDVVANDSNTAGPTANGTTGTDATGKNAEDVSVAALEASTEMTEVGVNISARLGMITPFIDAAFVNEETTSASYLTEQTTDNVVEKKASDYDGYSVFGAGVSINIRNRVTGVVSYYEVQDRDDFSENTVSGNLRINF